MQTIKKDELFRNLGDFLKSKGIELKDGGYTTRIQQASNLLSDAINATQKTVKKTKAQVDNALDQLRETIHESTAPKPPPGSRKSRRAKTRSKAGTKRRSTKAKTPRPKSVSPQP
jgi:hypothetical protein